MRVPSAREFRLFSKKNRFHTTWSLLIPVTNVTGNALIPKSIHNFTFLLYAIPSWLEVKKITIVRLRLCRCGDLWGPKLRILVHRFLHINPQEYSLEDRNTFLWFYWALLDREYCWVLLERERQLFYYLYNYIKLFFYYLYNYINLMLW